MSRIRRTDVFDSDPMYVGETRRRGLVVALEEGEAIDPATATWRLYDAATDLPKTAEAAAVVQGNKVFAHVPAGDQVGQRYVVFTYRIGVEVLRGKVNFEVKALGD